MGPGAAHPLPPGAPGVSAPSRSVPEAHAGAFGTQLGEAVAAVSASVLHEKPVSHPLIGVPGATSGTCTVSALAQNITLSLGE